MGMLDIFNSDGFSIHALTASIEHIPFTPGRIGELGLFKNKPATTDIAYIEERFGRLALLPVKSRGERGQTTGSTPVRKMRPISIPHVPQWRTVLASDLVGRRAFGSETEVQIFSSVVNDNLAEMKAWHETTHEYHRMGALKGMLLDADGSTILMNYFTEFGIVQQEIDFNVYNGGSYAVPVPATNVKTLCTMIQRAIRNSLGMDRYTSIHAFCGDEYYDYLVKHPTVVDSYRNWNAATMLQKTQISHGEVFNFGGIDWENYRGSIGSTPFVASNEAVIFPVGADGVFLEIPGPAQFIETVNTKGQMIYAKQRVMDWDEGVEIRTESNVLYICTRPGCVVHSIITNTLGTGT